MNSLHVDDAFVSHYQLSYDPFAAKVPNFKFFAPQRKPVLGQLHHLARYSQLLLVVLGPQGSGKTLLRQALVASSNKQVVQNLVVSASNASSRAALLSYIAQGLQAPIVGLAGIQDRIKQLAMTGQEVHLIVDDAELLEDDAIATLIDLASGIDDARAHVFLFADLELETRLTGLGQGQDRFHVMHLAPYSEEETRDYLASRLEGAGQGIELFDDEQLAEIHHHSGGWPGLINDVARDVLIEGMHAERDADKTPERAFSVPKKHILAVAVILIGVGAAWFMQGRPDSEQMSSSTRTELPLNSAAHSPEASNSPFVGANSVESSVPSAPINASAPVALALPNTAAPVIRQPLAEAASPDAEETVIAPETSIKPVTVQPAEPVSTAPEVESKPEQIEVAKAPSAQQVVSETSVKPVQKPAVTGNWYVNQPPGNFTLQVFATAKEDNAKNYIAQFGSGFHYFKKHHQGQLLYVVTYGSFASAQAASSAVAALPAKVREAKPWPKTIATIRQEMAQ